MRDGRICLYSTKVQFVLGDRHATGMIIRCGHWHAELEGYYQSLRHGCHGARFWGRENQWRNKSPVDTPAAYRDGLPASSNSISQYLKVTQPVASSHSI